MKSLRRFPALAAALASLAASTATATDDPHGATFNIQCATSCHATHTAAGNALTNTLGNDNLCRSCHNLTGQAQRFPMESMTAASLSAGTGSSHAWNVASSNASAGAGVPANAQMAVRLDAGQIICSTCHDQHVNLSTAVAAATSGTQWAGIVNHIFGTGAGSVTFSAAATATSKGYTLEIVETATKFRLSNDGGLSWWGCTGTMPNPTWVAYAVGNACAVGAGIRLNDGANVTVTFSGTFVVGDKYRFFISYPFLRAPLDSGTNAAGGKLCRDCHTSWAMDHARVEGNDAAYPANGTNLFYHPVGEALNANARGYDRAAPLDGDGTASDGNPTNDLKLAPDSTVQCYTCHGVHHAPGNTLYAFAP